MIVNADIEYRAIFIAIAQGSETAFGSLFVQYRGKIYAVAFKFTKSAYAAEEITQDTFIALWTCRAQLTAVNDPEAYLYTIVYNKISRYLKRETNQNRILKMSLWNKKTSSNETEELVMANDSQQFINDAISKLSPQKKLIYQLSRQQGKSYDEIAKALHLSRNTVKTHLVKALKFVRDYMKEHALLLICCIAYLFAKAHLP